MSGSYNELLVLFTILIAVASSYTALDLSDRSGSAQTRGRRTAWLAAAAFSLGGGIWAMHFVAMMAYSMPGIPVSYSIGWTALSFSLAVSATGTGFCLVNKLPRSSWGSMLSGFVMGSGIAGMHYLGMSAIRAPLTVSHDALWVVISLVIAVSAATTALWVSFQDTRPTLKLIAAIALGAAICGMHFSGMQAAIYTPNSASEALHLGGVGQTTLAGVVSGITFSILSLGMITAASDRRLAQRKEIEATLLRDSEERFRLMYRRTPLPLQALDADDRIIEVSDAWLNLFGFKREDVIGRSISRFFTESSIKKRDLLAGSAHRGMEDIWTAEAAMIDKDDGIIHVEITSRSELNVAGRFPSRIEGVVDVSARKKAEEALRQTQRMEALGQLTGGVAHEFNNLLTIILGNADELENQLSKQPNLQRLAAKTFESASQGAELISQLLAFSRKQTLEPKVINVAELVLGMENLLRRSLLESIDIDVRYGADLWMIQADAAQLETALLSLAVNAQDAMPLGGLLTIELANVVIDDKLQDQGPEGKGAQYVRISVTDTGCGMSADVLEHVFEPFFTTKEMGASSGLGLSMVYGFVKQSGGYTKVVSEPNKGAIFRLYFLRALENDYAPIIGSQPDAGQKLRGRKTILVVEDDDLVRDHVITQLVTLEYHVLSAPDGLKGLELIRSDARIDLLFTDVVMPGGMGGRDLANAARLFRPDLKVLFTSGYTADTLMHRDMLEIGAHLLKKPYNRARLDAKVREVMNSDRNELESVLVGPSLV